MFGEKLGLADRMLIGFGKVFGSSLFLNKGSENNVLVQLYDVRGKLKDERRVHNTTETAAKYGVADQCASAPSLTIAHWMDVGTGTNGTTALNAACTGSRKVCDSYTRALAVLTYVTTFGANIPTTPDPVAITEAGLFDQLASGGNMWLYSSFAAINKALVDTLVITWTLTLS
jgi:hypothetical protein